MIIIQSNNRNNITATDSLSASVIPVLTNYISKIKFTSLDVADSSKIILSINKNLDANEFTIKSSTSDIQIEANNTKFLRYGVYTLLEYWGFRKFTASNLYVPEVDYLEFPRSFFKTYRPSFSYRGLLYPDVYDEDYRDWHKLDWYKDDFGLWGHSFNIILPAKQYFDSNPNYFAYYDKKYNSESICMTNEQSFEMIATNIKNIVDQKPAKYYSISQNDGTVYCDCKKCKAINEKHGGPQGSLYFFLNKIANRFPNTNFTTLAYLHTYKAPIDLTIAPNITTILCPIDEDKGKSYISNNAFQKNLNNWKNATENLWIWDYNVQFTNYLNHFPNIHTYENNFTTFIDKKVSGAFIQGSADVNSDFYELKQYIVSKLLWDSNINVQDTIRDFLRGYYGKAALFIEQYLELLTKAHTESNTFLDIYGGPVQSINSYLNPQYISKLDEILQKAENTCSNDIIISNKLKKIRLSLEYIYFEQSKFYGKEQHGMFDVVNGKKVVKNKLIERVRMFIEHCEKNNIYELAEDGISPSQYYKNFIEITENTTNHKAEDLAVHFITQPAPEFTNKEKALTDGSRGHLDYAINWIGWYDTNPEIEIPLSNIEVRNLRINFLENQRHWMFLPKKIKIYGKINNKWKKITQYKFEKPTEKTTPEIFSFKSNLSKQEKYNSIKIVVQNTKKIPFWRYRKGKKNLIMIDEIEIN